MPVAKRLYKILKSLHCSHPGQHDRWAYRVGSGMASMFCDKCGRIILTEPVDDLPAAFIKQLKKNNTKPSEDEGLE